MSPMPVFTQTAQRGFSLVETAIALVITGMLTIAFVAYWKSASQHRTTTVERDLLTLADQSLQGFAQARFRLPCPDTDGDGIEDCASGAALGSLPWQTLGMADPRSRGLRYGVYRHSPPDIWKNADLATSRDRYRPLAVGMDKDQKLLAEEKLLGQSNLLDFCSALANGSNTPTSPTLLYQASLDASGAEIVAYRRNIAYALAAPGLLDADGDGNRFDGMQATQTAAMPVFDSPSRPHSAHYDDQVRAVSFDQFFSALSCGQALAAAGHAHFNASVSAEVTRQYLLDYKKLLELSNLMADAGIASATATITTAAAGVANASAASATALSDAFFTAGATSAIAGASVAAVVANGAALGAAIGTMAQAIATKTLAEQRVEDVTDILDNATILATSIHDNAVAADAAGF